MVCFHVLEPERKRIERSVVYTALERSLENIPPKYCVPATDENTITWFTQLAEKERTMDQKRLFFVIYTLTSKVPECD